MILFAKNFGRHVTGCTAGFFGILLFEIASDSEVSDSQVTLVIQYYVLRLDVSVDDVLLVEVIESLEETCYEELGLLLGELLSFVDVVSEVTT